MTNKRKQAEFNKLTYTVLMERLLREKPLIQDTEDYYALMIALARAIEEENRRIMEQILAENEEEIEKQIADEEGLPFI